jgi:hypothetical protein
MYAHVLLSQNCSNRCAELPGDFRMIAYLSENARWLGDAGEHCANVEVAVYIRGQNPWQPEFTAIPEQTQYTPLDGEPSAAFDRRSKPGETALREPHHPASLTRLDSQLLRSEGHPGLGKNVGC